MMARPSGKEAILTAFLIFCASSIGYAEDPNPPTIHSDRGAWPICRQWTLGETQHFADWIENIYLKKSEGTMKQRLAKIEGIFTDPEMNLLLDPAFLGEGGNPQLDLGTIRSLHQVIDCAKLAVSLTTYYAYRRGLPWMISYVRAHDGSDTRTADYTIPGGSTSSFDYRSAHDFFMDAVTGTCTGNYRVELNRRNTELSDTLPVAIDREHLLPGCLYYLDSHVLILATIDKYGEPRFLDATTAATREIHTQNGFNAVTGITPKRSSNAGSEYAGCFCGFRLQRYPIAEVGTDGEVKRVRRRTDKEMREFGFSTEQYDKMEELVSSGKIREGDLEVDSFHDFVRLRLRTARTIDLAQDIDDCARSLQQMLEMRERCVQEGWQDVQQNGPIPFPEDRRTENLFNAGGRWGAFSTAALDADIRARYLRLLGYTDYAMPWFDRSLEGIDLEALNKNAIWTRSDYASAAMRFKNYVFRQTTLSYINSVGEKVTLSLLDIEQRLFDLSFDPNHPPEIRWGAAPGSQEAKNAPESGTPLPDKTVIPMAEAYRREAYYRTLARRDTDPSYLRKMFTEGFSLPQKMDDAIAQKWFGGEASPPLVPHNGRLAWLKDQSQAQ
jgi:hypothetical protein